MSAQLCLEHVCVARPGGHAAAILTDISFAAYAGELLVVAGPNGSGKSTLLRIMCGLQIPDAGTVRLEGRRLAAFSLQERARRIAFVSQRGEENVPLTVFEAVLLGRAPWQNMFGSSTDEDVEQVRAALDKMEISALSGRFWTQLSGGERQRAFIARALCQNPRVLVLDEPTSALDYRHQLVLMDQLALLRDNGVCVVMATHDISLAARYANRLLLLKNGACLGQGAPREVLSEERLAKLYQCRLLVDEDPWTHTLRVTPFSCQPPSM